jgi:hypothetical protein
VLDPHLFYLTVAAVVCYSGMTMLASLYYAQYYYSTRHAGREDCARS